MTIKHKDELFNINITKPDKALKSAIKDRWDTIAKPLDSLGEFENIFMKIGAASGNVRVEIAPAYLVEMCADNGIVEEGVSQCGSYVTGVVAEKMGMGKSLSFIAAAAENISAVAVDVGIDGDTPAGVKKRKVRYGTRNFAKEPALTEEEVIKAISVGIEEAGEISEMGGKILLTGEMGIGNTTTSSAVSSAILGYPADKLTGRGAGLSDSALQKKIRIIDEAIERYGLLEIVDKKERAFKALQCVGGLDIAGLCGLCIGGAVYGIPVILDGLIAQTAALCAESILPGVKDYLVSSHIGKERGTKLISDALGLFTVIDAELALGEGSGAVMLYSMLKVVDVIYKTGAGFDEMGVAKYERFE